MVEIEPEGLCNHKVIDANVVLSDPAWVWAHLTAEVMQSIVVDVILRALVIKVHLFFTMKLALSLELFDRRDDLRPHYFELSLGASKANISS